MKFKLLENANDGVIRDWFKENYFDTSKLGNAEETKQAMYEHFRLNENDIEKFTPKKKKKSKKKKLDELLEDDKSEDIPDK